MQLLIFLIGLLPSNSAKISFSGSLLIPKTVFVFMEKIYDALCWPTSRGTKSFLSSFRLPPESPHKGVEQISLQKIFSFQLMQNIEV